MTTPTYNDPFGLLRNKKAAELAHGAFTALEAIPPAQRSRYSSPAEDATIELGLGYVQAVLAVLFGVVTTISYDCPGSAGRVSMRSTGGSTLYNFSWSEESERLLLGGFIHGGHPTYQVAVVGLCQAIAAYRCGATARYDEVIGHMYRGARMELAHTEVWTRECGPVWDDLQRLIDLDAAYAAHRRPTTSAAKQWRADHPAYDAILARIADHQRHTLGGYRWGKTQSLADYYRRAVALLACEGDILLSAPILVEGIPATALERPDEDDLLDAISALPTDSDRAAGAEMDEDGRGTRYQLLTGTIAGVEVVGVPDVLARDADGRLCVADYKTGTPHSHDELAENAQMAIYVELLRQNGYIARDDGVTIGHIYLTEDGVRAVWADTLQHTRVMARLERQVSLAAALMEHNLISDRKGLDTFQSPCGFCDLAHVCNA